jgi:hypothetical protein
VKYMSTLSFQTGAAEAPQLHRRPGLMAVAHAAWVVAFAAAAVALLASWRGYMVWFGGQIPLPSGHGPYNPFNILSGLMSLATVLLCLGLALVLFVRKRDEPMALFVSFYLLAYGVLLAGPLENLNEAFPGAAELAVGVIQPIFFLVPTVALIVLFPDGRAVPRWGRVLILAAAAIAVFLPFIDAGSFANVSTLPAQLMGISLAGALALALVAQIYRYRRVSTPTEREQTRWVVLGVALWLVMGMIQTPSFLYMQTLPPGATPPAWTSASGAIWWLSLAMIPLTLTIAILRYRLYEIDIIINRALVYGALAAILAGLYSASMAVLQKSFVALTGQQSDAAVVLTTLVLVSTVSPLHKRLEQAVRTRQSAAREPLRPITDFTKQVDGGVWVLNVPVALSKLMAEAVAAFDAGGGAAYMQADSGEVTLATRGDWHGDAGLSLPLSVQGRPLGRIALGPRRNGAPYAESDRAMLTAALEAIAVAME